MRTGLVKTALVVCAYIWSRNKYCSSSKEIATKPLHTQIVAVEGLICVFDIRSKCFPEGVGLNLDQETLSPLVSASECDGMSVLRTWAAAFGD